MDAPKKLNVRAWGTEHEELALTFLLEKGYQLVKKNFRFGKAGEIDLVMRDGEVYVFVEVKARRSHTFGLPEEAVNEGKRKQIRRIAKGFVHVMDLKEYEARFDVVAVDYATGSEGKPEIRHHVDAF
ncbi:MAG: YraN family protein [Candidatus Kapaibacterium sp.]